MNLMVIKRFRNELIILVATLFALFAFFYKLSAKNFIEEQKSQIVSSISEISRVNELKKYGKVNLSLKKQILLKL